MANSKFAYSVISNLGKKSFSSIADAENYAKNKSFYAIVDYGTGKWKEGTHFKLGKKKSVYAVEKPDGLYLYSVEKNLKKATALANDIYKSATSFGIPFVPIIYEIKELDGSFIKVSWKHS